MKQNQRLKNKETQKKTKQIIEVDETKCTCYKSGWNSILIWEDFTYLCFTILILRNKFIRFSKEANEKALLMNQLKSILRCNYIF